MCIDLVFIIILSTLQGFHIFNSGCCLQSSKHLDKYSYILQRIMSLDQISTNCLYFLIKKDPTLSSKAKRRNRIVGV